LVFRTPSGQPINADHLAKHFRSMLDLAGLPRLRLYDLRHSAATIALAAGVSPKVVSEQRSDQRKCRSAPDHSHIFLVVSSNIQEQTDYLDERYCCGNWGAQKRTLQMPQLA
jgi:hypothetical protein